MLRQVSVLPRCNHVANILDARTLAEGLQSLALAALDALTAIFAESYLSLGAVAAMLILCWCMASSGGYGAVPSGAPPPPPGSTTSFWDKMALKYVISYRDSQRHWRGRSSACGSSTLLLFRASWDDAPEEQCLAPCTPSWGPVIANALE